MDVVMDFGSEPVKDVDTKLQILKFSYSWIEEVEKEERLMKEVTEPAVVQKDEKKSECKVKIFTTETNELPRETVLDFDERPVTDVDEKLEILKFPYSWAEMVEEQERKAKENNEPAVEQTNKKEVESNVKILREERNEIPRGPILDFDEGPVTNLEEKLEILKFPYKWADIVEEEERGTKEPSMLNKAILEDTDHEKVTQEEKPKQDIAPNNISKPQDLPQVLKAEIGTDKETKELEATCSKVETKQIKLEFLSNDEDKNDNCFVPRKLFLFGIVEFKSDLKRPNKNVEQPKIPEKPTDALNSTNESVANVAFVKRKTGIRRKIKTFLGIR